MTIYLGPAMSLELADGTVIKTGDEVSIDEATQKALEAAGHRFSTTDAAPAPQSASENLAAQGTTAEQQAAESGLSVDAPAPPTAPAPAPASPTPAPPRTPKP